MPLTLSPNIAQPDQFYETLLRAHDGLSAEDSSALNARLVLILSNHIGDPEILKDALRAAENHSFG